MEKEQEQLILDEERYNTKKQCQKILDMDKKLVEAGIDISKIPLTAEGVDKVLKALNK